MFERNMHAYSIWDQERLWKATVIVVGIGGGGGVVAELLVRSGIGHLILIDGDKFEESNINRQIFATQNTIGLDKVDAARKRLLSINPNITIETYATFLSVNNDIIKSYSDAIVCDCSDGIKNKLMVADLCVKNGNKLVTGGDGLYNFFVAKFPEPNIKNTHIVFDGVAPQIIFPAPVTVWAQASLQAYEVINTILGHHSETDNNIQRYNLSTYTNTVTEE